MRVCQHTNYDNEQDCANWAFVMCMCCAVPMCREHGNGLCQYGGMAFIDLEDLQDNPPTSGGEG